jgi:hypothetical protein
MSEAIKTIGTSRIRHLRGGGIIVQQRRDDRELFAEIMIQVHSLLASADPEFAVHVKGVLHAIAGNIKGKRCDANPLSRRSMKKALALK